MKFVVHTTTLKTVANLYNKIRGVTCERVCTEKKCVLAHPYTHCYPKKQNKTNSIHELCHRTVYIQCIMFSFSSCM